VFKEEITLDLAIINTWLVTFKGKGLGIIPNGALGIEKDKIIFVGKSKDLNHRSADKIIDGTDKVTMPGLINAHAHTNLTLLRGSAQDLPELEWMNKGIGPFTKHLKENDLILGSKLGVLEGVKSGTTSFVEYSRSVSSLIKGVFLPFKVRVIAIETINEISSDSDRALLKPTDLYDFDHSKGENALKNTNQLFQEFQDHSLVSLMYGPQALDMISLELLREIKEQALSRGCKIHMHVAQGQRERLQIQRRYGKDTSSVKFLEKNDLLDGQLIAAHIHDTSRGEKELMIEKGVNMVGCPSSISNIDGIVPPVFEYLQLGGKAAIGTDQAPGTGHFNMFQEMKTLSILTKVIHKDPTALPPWQALKLTTTNAAAILGLENKIGSLEIGKQADIITIDLSNLNLSPIVALPFHNFIPNLVYSTTGNEITDVIINGETIISNKQFLHVDCKSIINEANSRAQELFAEATEDWLKANSKMVTYRKQGFL